MVKKIIAILLAVAMFVPAFSPIAGVSRVQAAESVTYSIGDFYYASDLHVEKDYKELYYYSDSYFADSAFNYDASLATMSMCLSMSAFRSNRVDYDEKYINLKNLLEDCGFTKFAANSTFKKQPTDNGTAFGCAQKKIKVNGGTYTLIALAVSGGGRLESEWSGVFRLGRSGNLENAETGAVEILDFLEDYIEDNNITGNVKLWMTGYASGAGKVNLAAGKLDDGHSLSSEITLKPENRYTYCLQCPRVAKTTYGLSDSKYKNIFSVNNPYNVTNYMAPTQYGFGRFGVLKNFPTKNSDSNYSEKRDKMLYELDALSETEPYIIDQFRMKKISIFGDGMVADDTSKNYDQAQFIDYFVELLVTDCAPTRADYVENYQENFCTLVKCMFGTTIPGWTDGIFIFLKAVQEDILSCGIDIVLGRESSLSNKYYNHAKDSVSKAGVTHISDSDIRLFADVLARLSIDFGASNPNETVTLLYAFPSLIQAFYPPINLAWMRSMDENYIGDKRDLTKCKASLSKTSYDYDGEAKKPSVTVKNGDIKLTKGTDYTVSYSKNKNAGKATVTIKGIGIYSGTIKKTFTINKVKNTISASNVTKTYSSKDRSFTLDVSAKGDAELSFKSNNSKIKVNSAGKVTIAAKYMGEGYITITAAETTNYVKTSKKIKITCKPLKVDLIQASSLKKGTFTFEMKACPSVSGYQVQYSTNKKFEKNTYARTLKASDLKDYTKDGKIKTSMSQLTSGKKYYVKIRAYKNIKRTVDGETKTVKLYGSWSKTKGFTVK